MAEYRTFIVPYDFSVHSRAALFAAVDLARRLSADLQLLHVVQPPSYAYAYASQAGAVAVPPIDLSEVCERATALLGDVADGIEDFPGKIETRVVQGSDVADTIRAMAHALDADLVIMGTHGRSGLAHVFLGSVAERTLRHAPCPVLTVHEPEAAEAGD